MSDYQKCSVGKIPCAAFVLTDQPILRSLNHSPMTMVSVSSFESAIYVTFTVGKNMNVILNVCDAQCIHMENNYNVRFCSFKINSWLYLYSCD